MKNNLTLFAREGKAKSLQNTGGGASRHEALIIAEQFSQCQTSRSEGAQQSTAQHDSARVFNYFNTQMARFLWNKKGEATVSKSSCSWAQGRATSAEQPTNHALITHLSPTQTVSLARIWKYVACLLLVLFVGVGNVWGDVTYDLTGYSTQITNGWTHDYGDIYVGRKGSNYTPVEGGLPTGNSNIFAAFQVTESSSIRVVFVWTKTNGDLSDKQIDLASINKATYDKLALASTGTGNDVKYSIDNFSSSQHSAVAINRSDANKDINIDFETTVSAGYYAVYTASSINASALIKKIIVTPAAASCEDAPTVSSITKGATTATTQVMNCAGISSLGSEGCTISSYGFVYGTSANPTISDTKVQVGTTYTTTGTAFATTTLTGLTPSTTYYVRAYATNGAGTAYSSGDSFTTPASIGNVVYIAGSADASNDAIKALRDANYVVTVRTKAGSPDYTGVDLVVLDESLTWANSDEGGSVIAADVPILNLKAFFYTLSSRWNWGTPVNPSPKSELATLSTEYSNVSSHPIFDGVTISEGAVDMIGTAKDGNNLQGVTTSTLLSGKEGYTLATSASGTTCIHELTPVQRGVTNSKYLLIALSNNIKDNYSADAKKMIVNAAAYLIDNSEQWEPVAPSCAATAEAGADKSTTVGEGVAMAATAATSGYTGAWSIKDGSPSTDAGQLGTTSSNTMTFTPNNTGTYTLVWTVTDDNDNTCYATSEATVTVTAPTHSVSAITSTGNNTYGSVSAASATVAEGSTVLITAVPATGYRVANWAVSGTGATIDPSGSSNSNTTTLTMGTANATVTVTFEEKPCPTSGTLFSLSSVGSGYSNNSDAETELTDITISGGSAYGYGTSERALSYNSNKIKYAGSANYIKLVLDCPLQAGDVISVTCDANTGLNFNSSGTSAAGNESYATGALNGSAYTVVADDGLEGAYSIYCWRRTGNGTNVTAITITRPLKYAVTYSSEKGVAPSNASAASVTLAEITGVSGWKNTGWKANVATEVGGESVDANTLIANGSVVTLSGATTFTAQWAQTYAVTFTFGAGSGTAPSGFESVEGAKFNLPGQGEMVAPSGKAFDGWKAGSTKYAAGAEYTMDDAAVEFVAQWKATPKVIYYWQSSYSGSPTMNSAESVTGGTIEWKTDDGSKSWGNETYNKGSNEVPAELQVASGKKAVKSGGNALYAELTLSGTEKFQEGDTIYVGGYKKWMFSTTKQRYDGTTPSDDATKPMSGDVALVATGSSNSSYDDGYAIIPAGINVSTMYLIRGEGATSSIAAIKVIRPAQKEVKSTVYDLTAVKINGTAISAADLATLKTGEDYLLDLATEYPVGPTVKFARKTTITYEDDSYKVKNDTITVTASEVSGKWQAQGTIGTITYTVKAAKVSAAKVTYYDGAMKLGEEIVAINGNPAEYAAKQSKNLATFVGWYSNADLADEHKIANIAELTVSKDTTVYGKWTNKYAVSTNIEQWVLTNGAGKTATTKTSALISQLGTNNFASNLAWENGNLELDSLDDDPSKDARNNAYLGLKVKKSGKMLDFRLAASKTVKVKFGEIKSTLPQVAINGGEYAAMSITDKVYTYTAAADAYISIKTADANTIVFKQIMIGDDPEFETVVLPYRVTYDADGGIFANDGKSDIYTGTPLSIGDATPADAENYLFDGWYDGDTKINAAAYEPTKNVTLVAKYVMKPSPFSLSALTYQIGAGAATAVGYVEGTYEYEVKLPYASSYETITVAYTLADGTSSTKAGAVLNVTSVPGAATFTVVAANETEKTYTVNFKKAAKDGVEIIGAVVTGDETADVTGLYKGTASVMLNDKKIDKGDYYIYVTLKEGYTFQDGDVLVVDVNAKSSGIGTEALEISTGEGNLDNGILISLAVNEYSTGENTIVLSSVPAGATSIGLKRSSNQNAKIDGLKVYRPMNPVMTAITLGVDEVFEVEAVKGTGNTFSATLPYGTDLDDLEATPTYYWNGAGTISAPTWAWGANTYTLTDKDGDATVYTITLVEAEVSRDATLNALSYGGTAIDLVQGVFNYTVNLPYGTEDVPELSATKNHPGAATPVIANAASFSNHQAVSTVTIKAQDGTTTQVYTVTFKVALCPTVVIWDGSSMSAIASSPHAASGLVWTVASDQSGKMAVTNYSAAAGPIVCADNGKTYTTFNGGNSKHECKYIATGGNTKSGRSFKITVPVDYMVQLYVVFGTHSEEARTLFIDKVVGSSVSESTVAQATNDDRYNLTALTVMLEGSNVATVDYYINATNSLDIYEIDATVISLDYTRTVTVGRMGTICVNHNVPAGYIFGAEVYKLLYWKYGTDWYDCQMVDFEQVEEMNAGEPYMIIPTSEMFGLHYGETVASSPKTINGFIGTFDPITAASDALYGMYGVVNNMIQKLGHNCYSAANRAYIDLEQTPSKEEYDAQPHMTNHAPRKRVSLGHKITTEDEPIATGLDAINVESEDVQKVLINGEMFIIRDGHIYSATGMMVK